MTTASSWCSSSSRKAWLQSMYGGASKEGEGTGQQGRQTGRGCNVIRLSNGFRDQNPLPFMPGCRHSMHGGARVSSPTKRSACITVLLFCSARRSRLKKDEENEVRPRGARGGAQ